MFKPSRRVAAVVASAALAATGLGASAAFGATQHDVRQSDFNSGLADERSAGHHDFLKEGLHVYTDDSSSQAKSAEYYAAPAGSGIPTSGSYDWYGTDNQAGSQIVFDTDGDPNNAGSYNVLVGEQVYTTGSASTDGDGQNLTDWWYTGGSSKAATNGITCPETTGGSGSDCHGSLQQWHDANGMQNAVVGYYGFSLGSGVKGDGVLRSQTYGNDEYVFTDETATTPPTTQNVVGYQSASKSGRTVRVDFHSQPLGANTTQGNKIRWSVTIDSSATQMFYDEMGAGENATYRYTAPAGKHVVHILRDGHQVNSVTVNK